MREAVITPKVAVVFIYCDYRDQTNQTILGIIGSFAKQLLSQIRPIPPAVREVHEEMTKEQKSVNLESAEAIFKLVLQHFDSVYICVDALDECYLNTRKQLLQFLNRVTGTTLRLFVTSRPNIEPEVVRSLGNMLVSNMPIAANEEDIRLYLTQQFAEDHHPEAMDDTLRARITDMIIKWSQGM